jgi:3-phenylpropionate/cinnamic acid dioxygenase small subunit
MTAPADDRQAIVDRLHAYGWALDDRDWAAVAGCFAADGEADYGPELGVHRGGEAVAALCATALAPLDSSQHLITNHQIAIAGDTADVRCHVVAQHTRAAGRGGANYTIGGTYRAALVRTGGGWLIRRFALEIRWREGNLAVLERA